MFKATSFCLVVSCKNRKGILIWSNPLFFSPKIRGKFHFHYLFFNIFTISLFFSSLIFTTLTPFIWNNSTTFFLFFLLFFFDLLYYSLWVVISFLLCLFIYHNNVLFLSSFFLCVCHQRVVALFCSSNQIICCSLLREIGSWKFPFFCCSSLTTKS